MKRISIIIIGVVVVLGLTLFPKLEFKANAMTQAKLKFNVSFPETASKEPLDGRLLLLISKNNEREPRFQISEDLNTQQVFGVDLDGLKPDAEAIIDDSAFGYPVRNLAQLAPGEY